MNAMKRTFAVVTLRWSLRLAALVVLVACGDDSEVGGAGSGETAASTGQASTGVASTGASTSAVEADSTDTSAAASSEGTTGSGDVDTSTSATGSSGGTTEADAMIECDWLAQPDGARELGLCTPSLTWQDAEDECVALGGNLASFSSASENLFAINVLTGVQEAWIGLNDIDEAGTYVWTDGVRYAYLNWDDTQPDEPMDNCTVIGVSQRWFDYACDETRPFICARAL